MKRAVLVALTVPILGACGYARPSGAHNTNAGTKQRTTVTVVTDWSANDSQGGDLNWEREVIVNGRDCIEVQHGNSGTGIYCVEPSPSPGPSPSSSYEVP